jgi:hypothetical protein
MAEPFAPYAGIEGAALTGGEGGDLLQQLIAGIIGGTVTLPERVIKATQATAPGLRREDFTDVPGRAQPGAEMREGAMEAAMNIGGLSAPFATSGAVGVFGGRLAATADKAALARAEEMAAKGADRKAIWDETGWFKGGDDKWRFEIPDYKSTMHPSWHEGGVPNYRELPLENALHHQPLYAAYPDLRRTTSVTERTAGEGGSYMPAVPETPQIFGRSETINVQSPNAPAARSVALHEVQHAIQEREGFARGGAPSMFKQADDAKLSREALSYRRELEGLDPHLTPKQKDEIVRKRYADLGAEDWLPSPTARAIAHDVEGNPAPVLERVMAIYGTDVSTGGFTPRQLYRELPGEIEARNVQARRDMTPAELRARPPWETADIDPRPIMSEIFGSGRVGMLEGGAARSAEMSAPKAYPVAPRSEWYGDANFQQTGGRMVTMTPDEFLAKARPMKIDDVARENIDDLKAHMLSGKTLDPLAIYKNGKEDGRHRAIAAKELGLNEVPVLVWDK